MNRMTVLLTVSATLLSACGSTQWVQTPVAREYTFNVTLEQPPGNATTAPQKYAHPYEIEQADLEQLMGDLTYTKKVGSKEAKTPSPVFQAVEIDRLAPVLAEALAKADASQRVRFISFNQKKGMIFSVSQKTEAVTFIEPDGQLNIAFNHVNSERNPSETSAVYPNYSKVDPVKIKTSKSYLSPLPYAGLHQLESGEQAPMWLVADLEKMRGKAGASAPPVIKEAAEVSSAVTVETETHEPSSPKPEPRITPEETLNEDIRSKLIFLKKLLDEGLISEEDYNTRKMVLLDKID
jgi:hypothetical protein